MAGLRGASLHCCRKCSFQLQVEFQLPRMSSLRLVLDGFARREFDEAPPWQAGLRFWMLSLGDQSVVVRLLKAAKALASGYLLGVATEAPAANGICAGFTARS